MRGLEVAILGWALLYYARHASDYGHVWLEKMARSDRKSVV